MTEALATGLDELSAAVRGSVIGREDARLPITPPQAELRATVIVSRLEDRRAGDDGNMAFDMFAHEPGRRRP